MNQEINFLLNLKNDTSNELFTEPVTSSNRSSNSKHYEIMLPVVFILLFMAGLFIIYAIRNLDLKKIITKPLTKKRKSKRPYSLVHPRQEVYNRSAIYKKPTSLQGLNYYEDQTGGFYRVQNPYILNTHPANYIINNNYDQIYSAQTNNLILNLQACQLNNNVYQNDDYSNYNFQKIDQLASRNYISSNEVKKLDNLTRSIEIDYDQSNEKFVYRRSYSNSKLDYHKWQRALQKRPTYYKFDDWSSKVLSEFELKKFLSQENQFAFKRPNNNSSNLQVLRENCSESLLQINVNPAKVQILNSIYNSNGSNAYNPQKETLIQSKSFDRRDELTVNLTQENIYTNTELIKEKKMSMSKSYSGFTNHNEYYQGQVPYLNEKNDQVESYLMQQKAFSNNKLAHRMQTLDQINENEYSSFIFNSSELSSSANFNKIQKRSSTIKAVDSLNKSNIESSLLKFGNKLKNISTENMLFKNIYKELRGFKSLENDYDNEPNDTLFSTSYRDGPIGQKSSKYLRLCKSFTFLSNRSAEAKHIRKEKNFSKTFHSIVQHKSKKPERISASEPIKLSSSSSFKPSQNNYLKSFSLIKTKGYYSINSLVDKVSHVASLTKLKNNSEINFKPLVEKVNKNFGDDHGRYVHDAAVQTSIVISDTSSFNSHATTLQTNFYGSILGNFGSALIQRTQISYKMRPRAHSEGNVLSSDSNSSKSIPSSLCNHLSASSSKLCSLKNQV